MTTASTYTLTLADWQSACEDLYAVRRAVFVEEQGVPAELEQDTADRDCWHVLARAADGTPIATGRLLRDGHIGRLAVLPAWRGRGVGRAVMARLVELARTQGMRQLVLNAQLEALDFYEKLGFRAEGPRFLEAGIWHRAMRLSVLADGDGLCDRPLAGIDDSLAAALALINTTRRQLVVYTPYMHPRLYGAPAFSDALTQLIVGQPRIGVRLLLPSAREWRRDCAPLAELLQRLSALQLRCLPAEEPRDRPEFGQSFMLADNSALLLHRDPRTGSGHCTPRGGQDAQRLAGFFDDYWERSRRDVELRPLGI